MAILPAIFSDCVAGDLKFSARSAIGRQAPPDCVFMVMMAPRQFLALVPEMDCSESLDDINRLAASGEAFAFPLLEVEFEPDGEFDSYPRVIRHDGRHRMTALVCSLLGDIEIPVQVHCLRPAIEMSADQVISFRTAVWAQVDRQAEEHRLAVGPHFGAARFEDGRSFEGQELDELHPFLR